jgi:hypothetical protein
MKREFMSNLPGSVTTEDEDNGSKNIGDDDTVACLTIQDFMMTLQCSSEFHKNPTQATMEKVLRECVSEHIQTLLQDSRWYIKNAMPLFLVKDLKKESKGLVPNYN